MEMEYYNQNLIDYVGKICDVERELYTTQRLIGDLEHQIQRLGYSKEIAPPEAKEGKNPFNKNGGWYFVALLGIPISGVFQSITTGILLIRLRRA